MVLVTGHNFAYTDVDSIVSSVALAHVMRSSGQEAEGVIVNKDAVLTDTKEILSLVKGFNWPVFADKARLERESIALVDHNNVMESIGQLGVIKKPVLCIDHHMDTGLEANRKIIKRVGACCTILTEIIRQNSIAIDNTLAQALAVGIICDTKGLKSRKKCSKDIEMLDYLYSNYRMERTVEEITGAVLTVTDVRNMTDEQLTRESLKEYWDRKVGIATIEVMDDYYKSRLDGIIEECRKKPYDVFAFMIYRLHTEETHVYFFDRKYGVFPFCKTYNALISRSQDIIPYIKAGLQKAASPIR